MIPDRFLQCMVGCDADYMWMCRQQMKVKALTVQAAELLLEKPPQAPLLLQDADSLAAASSSVDVSAAIDARAQYTAAAPITHAGALLVNTFSAALSGAYRLPITQLKCMRTCARLLDNLQTASSSVLGVIVHCRQICSDGR